MKWVLLVIVVGLCLVEGKKGDRQRTGYEDAIELLTTNRLFKHLVEAHEADWRKASEKSRYPEHTMAARFTCSGTPSPTVPTSVHALRPGDIKVVAALGDSLTAADCSESWSILTCTRQYRGTSWSIGGDRSVNNDGVSLPNILKVFNPNVYGFSTGTGDHYSSGSRLNVARSGDESSDMLWQAFELVDRLNADPDVNMEDDWKLITLFIGGNDLCRSCGNEPFYTAAHYEAHIESALHYLHAHVPRALVQVAAIFDVGPLAEMGGLVCSLVHMYACDCVRSDEGRAKVTLLTREYQQKLQTMTSNPGLQNKDDFTVVYQPFFEEADPPRNGDGGMDTSFFGADCFHFSRKGHQMAARNLWNAMFQEYGNKEVDWEITGSIYCPGPNEYIATSKNKGSKRSDE